MAVEGAPSRRPSTPARVAFAVAIAVAAAAWITFAASVNPAHLSDFDQTWRAARLTLAGQDPYTLIGNGDDPRWHFRYYYPLPATLVAMPLAPLSLEAARACFVAFSTAVFAWAVTRERWREAIAFLTQGFFASVLLVQWTPLLGAATALPWLGWAFACKPNVGAIAAASFDDWRPMAKALAVALAITAVSFVVDPSWVPRWRAAVTTSEHFRPMVTRQWGWVMLLAALRWRRPEARLVLALAVIPYTPNSRETLLFFLTPLSWPAIAVLFVGPHLAARVMIAQTQGSSFLEYTNVSARWLLLLVYIPLTAAILARPNVGRMPAVVERVVARLPGWLRGRAAYVTPGGATAQS